MQRSVHRAEIVVALITIMVSALFLWDARRYSASPFEPIGSGAIPAGVAAGAMLLGVIMLRESVRGFAPRLTRLPSPIWGRACWRLSC